MAKAFSNVGVFRHLMLAPTMLWLLVAVGAIGCNPKSQDKPAPSEAQEQAAPDSGITHAEIQGLWVVESITQKKQAVIPQEKSAKTLSVFRISETHLQTLIFADGAPQENSKDEYRFENAKLQIEFQGNKNFKSREIILQRSDRNIVMIEKSWKMVLRKISEQELADLLKKPNDEAANQLIRFHEGLYRKSILEILDSKIQGLQAQDLKTLKLPLEQAVSNTEIIYNSPSDTLGHIVHESEIQCYSGTTLLVVAALKKFTQAQWDQSNMVVIHTSGHVLPGFVVREGERWKMFGIEMTASDDGLIEFGWTDQLKIPVRVVDALTWAKIEANPQKKQPEIRASALNAADTTHKKYLIPILPTPPLVDESGRSKLNSTPFAFGRIPPDQKNRRKAKPKTLAAYSSLKPQAPSFEKGESEEGLQQTTTCQKVAKFLARQPWTQIEFDLSHIQDIKTNALLTEEDLASRNLKTLIGLVLTETRFSLDFEKQSLNYSFLDEQKNTVQRAFKILRDDSVCVVGSEFESGPIEIEFNLGKFYYPDQGGLKFKATWINQYFKQTGFLHLSK